MFNRTLLLAVLVAAFGSGFQHGYNTGVINELFFCFQPTSRTATYASIGLIFLYVAFFAIGPASIPWLIVPELFNQSARALATTIAVVVNWFCNFVIGIGFLPLEEIMKAYVFIIFIVLLAIFFIFTWKKVPFSTVNLKIKNFF